MFIEFTDRTFNKKLVQLACAGLDFPYEKRRNQFYAEALVPITVSDCRFCTNSSSHHDFLLATD